MTKFTFEINQSGNVSRVYVSAADEATARDFLYRRYDDIAWAEVLDAVSYDDYEEALTEDEEEAIA